MEIKEIETMKPLSVTEVLRPYADFSMVPNDVLWSASERGKRVHKACAILACGGFPVLPEEEMGYLQSFEKWFTMVDEVLSVEAEYQNPKLGLVGHPDLVVRIKNKIVLTDLKTPLSHISIWEAQLSAYKHLVYPTFAIDQTQSLQLRPNGQTPKANVLSLEREAHALVAFMGALNAYRFFKGV